MKKLRRLLITISYIFIMVNCKLEVPIDEPKNTVSDTEIIIEEQIMNDFIVKPFTEYPAYFVQGNAVSGIPAGCKDPTDLMRFLPEIEIDGEVSISNFDTFFVKDGKVYFTVSANFPSTVEGEESETITKYCTIENGTVKYLTESKFPEMPESERAEGSTGKYTILVSEYNDESISVADNEVYTESFIMIDGFIEIEGGLLIHTPTGRGSSRPAGLLFWPEDKRTMNPWKEVGRFWK